MLSITELTAGYKRVPVLRTVSLTVGAGEYVGLVGPNGAGKSTTLKSIFGLVKPSSGDIEFEGQSLKGKAPEQIARLGIGLVPEGRHIFQSLTVGENIALGYSAGAGRYKAHESEVLDRFPILRRYYKSPAAGLSGGEQQQLAIARVLVSRPRMLLLDEPSLGLAPLLVSEVFRILESLRRDGVTVLLVEQNATRTVESADRTYVMSSGRIIVSGTAADLGSEALQQAYLGAST